MNYSKFSGQFVCKMAMLLAFMFAACSETNSGSDVAGGTVEETGVYALAGQVGDVYPKLISVADSAKTDDGSSKYGGSVFAGQGTVVAVYELDSLTLDTTGRYFVGSVGNDSGSFAFENLALKSPYVLIETLDSCYKEDCLDRGMLFGSQTSSFSLYCNDSLFAGSEECSKKYLNVLSAMVDLRNVKKVSVSSLTTSKIPLLKKYFAEGKSFAEAGEMAEREMLENLGIYENLGAFEDLSRNDSELPYVNELFRLDDFGVRYEISKIDIPLYFAPSKAFSIQGEDIGQYYLNSMKMIEYKLGYLARQDSLGRCTEARENETGRVKGIVKRSDVAVVCRSGKWTLGFKTIEHTKGMMTDKRDGKTYKTVTYNWGGTSQTWMAENLDFTDAANTCYRSKLDNGDCEAYGRAYPWNVAMNIKSDDMKTYAVDAQGDTVFMSKRCLDAYMSESGLGSVEALVDSCNVALYGSDSMESKMASTVWTWNYEDYITPSNQGSYQGICPDGWRVPTYDDWKTLLQNLGEQYGVHYDSVDPVLYDSVATGFNMESHLLVLGSSYKMLIRYIGFYNYFVVADTRFYEVEFFNRWSWDDGFDLQFSSAEHATIQKENNMEQYPEFFQNDFRDPYQTAAVRCIKD